MKCVSLTFVCLWYTASPFTASVRHHWKQVTSPVILSRTVENSICESADSGDTVRWLENPLTGQLITLVGTAHLSEASNDQVRSIIESSHPDVVMVELDENRLHRIGFQSVDDIKLPVSTADDIVPPPKEDDKLAAANKPWWKPVQDFFLDAFTKVARGMLTNMYDDMGESMGDNMVGGGEFLAAITAAQAEAACQKIILGDRDSLATIRRAAELAIRSGDPIGVLSRLGDANQQEMNTLRQNVLEDMKRSGEEIDVGALNVALVEAIKTNKEFRSRLFSRLEEEVPEFTRAFMQERDYIMAESIRREEDARHVVAVVGLAHVPGMAENLESGWREKSLNKPDVALAEKTVTLGK